MGRGLSLFALVCLGAACAGCGTVTVIGSKEDKVVPAARPEGAAAYCLFVSSYVPGEIRNAIKGAEYAGVPAEERYNLYAATITWVLVFSSDIFQETRNRLGAAGFDPRSPLLTKPEQLPYFAGNSDGTKACYARKY
ncbi:MAG: hypothetical protein LBG84_07335 [Treponema sp.]|jgi:hypothetical protein|nr:hypothetical protein [Treponema sp.]